MVGVRQLRPPVHRRKVSDRRVAADVDKVGILDDLNLAAGSFCVRCAYLKTHNSWGMENTLASRRRVAIIVFPT